MFRSTRRGRDTRSRARFLRTALIRPPASACWATVSLQCRLATREIQVSAASICDPKPAQWEWLVEGAALSQISHAYARSGMVCLGNQGQKKTQPDEPFGFGIGDEAI